MLNFEISEQKSLVSIQVSHFTVLSNYAEDLEYM